MYRSACQMFTLEITSSIKLTLSFAKCFLKALYMQCTMVGVMQCAYVEESLIPVPQSLIPIPHIMNVFSSIFEEHTPFILQGNIIRCSIFTEWKRHDFQLSLCDGSESFLVSCLSVPWFLKYLAETQGFLGTRFENYWFYQHFPKFGTLTLIPRERSMGRNKSVVIQWFKNFFLAMFGVPRPNAMK